VPATSVAGFSWGKQMVKPDFIVIPVQLLEDSTLNAMDRTLYGYIYWLERLKDGKCIASNKTLAELCITTPRTIQNSLIRLKKQGYIEVLLDPRTNYRKGISCKVSYGATPSPTGDTPSSVDDPPHHLQVTPPSSTDDQNNKSNKKKSNEKESANALATPSLPDQTAYKTSISKTGVPDKRISAIIKHFETTYGIKLPRQLQQRRAASTLLRQYEESQITEMIEYSHELLHQQYAPQILSIEDLYNKWNNLMAYGYRQVNQPSSVAVIK
jgi:hypothetical protein